MFTDSVLKSVSPPTQSGRLQPNPSRRHQRPGQQQQQQVSSEVVLSKVRHIQAGRADCKSLGARVIASLLVDRRESNESWIKGSDNWTAWRQQLVRLSVTVFEYEVDKCAACKQSPP